MPAPDVPLRRPVADRRRPVRPGPVLLLQVVWLLLWGRVTPNLVLSGVLVAVLVVWAFPLPAVRGRGRLRPVGALRLAGRFVLDLAVASVQIAALAVGPGSRARTAVVAVGLRTRSELVMTLVAQGVTLVPGTLVIELRRRTGTLFLHVLDSPGGDPVAEARESVLALEARVLRAFGSDEDIASLDAEARR